MKYIFLFTALILFTGCYGNYSEIRIIINKDGSIDRVYSLNIDNTSDLAGYSLYPVHSTGETRTMKTSEKLPGLSEKDNKSTGILYFLDHFDSITAYRKSLERAESENHRVKTDAHLTRKNMLFYTYYQYTEHLDKLTLNPEVHIGDFITGSDLAELITEENKSESQFYKKYLLWIIKSSLFNYFDRIVKENPETGEAIRLIKEKCKTMPENIETDKISGYLKTLTDQTTYSLLAGEKSDSELKDMIFNRLPIYQYIIDLQSKIASFEITMPGQIIATTTKNIRGNTAVYSDLFYSQLLFDGFDITVTSRVMNYPLLAVLIVLTLLSTISALLVIIRKRGEK